MDKVWPRALEIRGTCKQRIGRNRHMTVAGIDPRVGALLAGTFRASRGASARYLRHLQAAHNCREFRRTPAGNGTVRPGVCAAWRDWTMKRLLVLCLSLTACALEAEPEAYDAAVVSAELTTPPIVCNRNRVSSVSPSSVGLSDFTPDNQWASRSYGSSNLAAVKMYVSLGPSSPVSENSATQLHIQSTAPGCYFAELYAVSYCKNAWGSLPQEIREAGRWYGPNDGVFKSILRCPTWENGDPSSYAPSSQAFMQVKIFAYAPKL